jgi:hypothetical protein
MEFLSLIGIAAACLYTALETLALCNAAAWTREQDGRIRASALVLRYRYLSPTLRPGLMTKLGLQPHYRSGPVAALMATGVAASALAGLPAAASLGAAALASLGFVAATRRWQADDATQAVQAMAMIDTLAQGKTKT